VPDRRHPADLTGARSPGGQLVVGQHAAPDQPDAAQDAQPWGPLCSTLARTCSDQAVGGVHRRGRPGPQRATVHGAAGGSSAGPGATAPRGSLPGVVHAPARNAASRGRS
jgi:hypothetical protein